MADRALGWQITVKMPDGGVHRVYNVAIPDEREAIEAVRRTLEDAERAVIKVKCELTERIFEGLRLRLGDVMSGAQRKRAGGKADRPGKHDRDPAAICVDQPRAKKGKGGASSRIGRPVIKAT